MKKIQRCLWITKDLNTIIQDKASDLGITVTAYINIALHEKINKKEER